MMALLFSVGLILVIYTGARVLRRRQSGIDPLIDGLVAANKFKYRPEMNETDWHRVREIGRSNWDDVARAQERVR